MPQPTPTPIRIAALGMDEHACRMLHIVFQGPGKGAYALVEESLAEAAIFDLDGFDAETLWKSFRERRVGLPTVVLSLLPKRYSGAVYVKKPVQVHELLHALEKLAPQVRDKRESAAQLAQPLSETAHTPPGRAANAGLHGVTQVMEQTNIRRSSRYAEDGVCGYNPDIDPNNPKELPRVFYDPAKHIQGLLGQAVRMVEGQNQAVRLSGLAGQIILLPHKNQVLCDMGEEKLRTICMLPLPDKHVQAVAFPGEQVVELVRGATSPLRYHYLDRFLWQVAVWSAHGRVPKGTELSAPVVLLHWPNFTRLLITPYALQITSLWIGRAYSLLETAKILNIPQRYVFTFYSAAHALKLAFPDRRAFPHPSSEARPEAEVAPAGLQVDARKRGLLRRLLSHLHIHSA